MHRLFYASLQEVDAGCRISCPCTQPLRVLIASWWVSYQSSCAVWLISGRVPPGVLTVVLHTCVATHLLVGLHPYLWCYILTWGVTYLPVVLPTYLWCYLPTCSVTYIPVVLPTYQWCYLRTSGVTYVPVVLPTCLKHYLSEALLTCPWPQYLSGTLLALGATWWKLA